MKSCKGFVYISRIFVLCFFLSCMGSVLQCNAYATSHTKKPVNIIPEGIHSSESIRSKKKNKEVHVKKSVHTDSIIGIVMCIQPIANQLLTGRRVTSFHIKPTQKK